MEHELQSLNDRREIVRQKLELASMHRDLAQIFSEISAQEALSDDEQKKLASIRDALGESIKTEIKKISLPAPVNIEISQFLVGWVDENWQSLLHHTSATAGRLPRSVIEAALKALYQEDQAIHEAREELFEIQRGIGRDSRQQAKSQWLARFKTKFRDKADAYRAKKRVKSNLPSGPETENKPGFDVKGRLYAKRASELRAKKNQHRIQQFFSKISFVFTGGAALFMVAMLALGLSQLYNAAAIGIGIAWRIPEVHAQTDLGGSSLPPAEVHWLEQNPHAAMHRSLTALEIILVAPLPYLLVLGLTRYIKALAYQEQAAEFRKELLEFKAFEVALFIAIIAAAVVGRVLENKFDLQFAAAVSLIVGILATYYFLIDRSSKEAANEERRLRIEREQARSKAGSRRYLITPDQDGSTRHG